MDFQIHKLFKKRINKLILLIFFSFVTIAQGQNQIEFKKHLKSIDSTFFPGHITDRTDSIFNANRAFVNYTIKNLLENPSDKYFISNRKLLPKLKMINCDSLQIEIKDTLLTGEICHMKILTRSFDSRKSINNQFPHGTQYTLPKRDIAEINITINGIPLYIPNNAFNNLFEPTICEEDSFHKKIEAYMSLDGNYLYLYIYGGNAAGTYFSKLIFDKKMYLTRIITDYYSLSIHGSFRDSFIGF